MREQPDISAAYAAARDELAGLEHDLATIDAKIRAAGLQGDVGTMAQHMARKHVLPVLVDQARRKLAPLEVEYLDAEITRITEEAAPRYAAIEAAQAEVDRAYAALSLAIGAIGETTEHINALKAQRKQAWRRAQHFAATPEGTERKQPPVVRSGWQAA